MDMNQSSSAQLVVRKSNELVGAKYKSNLLENQMVAIAMTRIEADNNDDVCAKLYPGELKKLINRDNNLYAELKTIGTMMTGHTIVLEDGKGNFKAFALIKTAEYKDGVFTIKFNEEIKPHMFDLRDNYTTLSLSTLSSFKKNASFRLYELLIKEVGYKNKEYKQVGHISVVYGINELKFMIGLANADEKGVQKYLAKNQHTNIDWDYVYNEVCIEKSYDEWRDLRRRIIMPAQKELEEKSDIRFEFKGIRQGRTYGKIEFTIYPNDVSDEMKDAINAKAKIINETRIVDNPHQYNMFEMGHQDFFDKYRGHNNILSDGDIEIFLDDADGDEKKVERAINMADRQTEINNYIGWIRDCIKNGYAEPIDVIEGSHEKAVTIKQALASAQKNNKKKSALLWEKIKTKEDFPEFMSELEEAGFPFDQFDVAFEDDIKSKVYTAWWRKEDFESIINESFGN